MSTHCSLGSSAFASLQVDPLRVQQDQHGHRFLGLRVSCVLLCSLLLCASLVFMIMAIGRPRRSGLGRVGSLQVMAPSKFLLFSGEVQWAVRAAGWSSRSETSVVCFTWLLLSRLSVDCLGCFVLLIGAVVRQTRCMLVRMLVDNRCRWKLVMYVRDFEMIWWLRRYVRVCLIGSVANRST